MTLPLTFVRRLPGIALCKPLVMGLPSSPISRLPGLSVAPGGMVMYEIEAAEFHGGGHTGGSFLHKR